MGFHFFLLRGCLFFSFFSCVLLVVVFFLFLLGEHFHQSCDFVFSLGSPSLRISFLSQGSDLPTTQLRWLFFLLAKGIGKLFKIDGFGKVVRVDGPNAAISGLLTVSRIVIVSVITCTLVLLPPYLGLFDLVGSVTQIGLILRVL